MPDHGLIAPSFILKSLFGIIKSSSKKLCSPKPSQVGHAPTGLLNENSLGSISSIVNPDSGQANLAEYIFVLFFVKSSTYKSPSDNSRHVSMLSASLCLISFLMTILSITTSILFFVFLSIVGNSFIEYNSLFNFIL